jgi:hypothetical protein
MAAMCPFKAVNQWGGCVGRKRAAFVIFLILIISISAHYNGSSGDSGQVFALSLGMPQADIFRVGGVRMRGLLVLLDLAACLT